MNRRTSGLRVWIACAPLLAACGPTEQEPVSGKQLALTAQENLERALRGVHQAGSFIADSAVLAKTLSSGNLDCPPTAPCATGMQCPAPPACADAVTVDDLKESRDEIGEAIDDLVKALKEDVFTPENLESEDGSSAVYLLGPKFICESSSSDGVAVPTPGGAAPAPQPQPMPDPECVERAQKLQPRLRLSSPSAGDVDVALLLTAQRRNPVTLQLRDDGVGMLVDLGETKGALDAAGEDTKSLANMSGRLQFELHRNAERDYSFRLNVLSALSVGILDDLDQRVDIGWAAAAPAFEVRLDGNARNVSGTYNYGAISVHGPLNAFRKNEEDSLDANGNPAPRPPYTGTIEALLAGIDGSVTLDVDASRDKLALTNLGFGDQPSTLKFDGTTVAQIDLNPSAGHHFDLSIEKVADGQTAMTFSPTFDLNVLLNFAPLANQIADIPAYALGDTLRLWFDGTNPSVRAEPDQVRVLSGTLNMTSARTPAANLQVTTGNCLLDLPEGAASAHELLGQFAAGACK